MNRALQLAHMGLLLAGTALCLSGARYLWTLNQITTGAASQLATMATKAETAEQSLTDTLTAINRPCGAGRACGTLADLGKTLGTIRLTAGQLEIAANHEDKRIAVLDTQETELAEDAHRIALKTGTAVDSLNGTILAAGETVRGLQPVETELSETIAASRLTVAGINETLPDVQRTAQELAATSANVTETTQHLSATTADVQQAVHGYLHPTWAKKIWSAVTGVGLSAAKFFW